MGFFSWVILALIGYGIYNATRAKSEGSKIQELQEAMITAHEQGNFSEGLEVALKVFNYISKHRGEDSIEAADAATSVANFYNALGNTSSAKEFYTKSLAIAREQNESNLKFNLLTINCNALGEIAWQSGAHEEAKKYYHEVLELAKANYLNNEPELMMAYDSPAQLYYQTGDFKKAAELFEAAIKAGEKNMMENPGMVKMMQSLADIRRVENNYEQAVHYTNRARQIIEKHTQADHPERRHANASLANLYMDRGDYQNAEPIFLEMLKDAEKQHETSHISSLQLLLNLVDLYRLKGNFVAAERYSIRALGVVEKYFGTRHVETLNALLGLGSLYTSQGKFSEAEPIYKRALSIQKEIYGKEHQEVARMYHNLADLFSTQGRSMESEAYFIRALDLSEKIFGPSHSYVGRILINLAHLCIPQGRYSEASTYYQRALKIYDHNLGPHHPDAAGLVRMMIDFYKNTGQSHELKLLEQRMQISQAKN